MPANTEPSVSKTRTARDELSDRRAPATLTTFFSIAKTARQTDSKLINEISVISTIVILSPRLDNGVIAANTQRFGPNPCILLRGVATAGENGGLKSGYYCRFDGDLSNSKQLWRADWI